MNIAELIVKALQQAGVRRIYGIAGDSLNALTEVLRNQTQIEWIHVRHEEVAAFAAGAEAHLSGSIAVCAGSCGPGNLHLINGLYDAFRSRVPVLAIAAQIPSSEIGRNYFQETHPQNLFQECSAFCELVTSPAQLPGVLETAIRVAVSESSVSVLVIPGDVATMELPSSTKLSASLVPAPALVRPHDSELDVLAKLLNDSTRVTLLCGRGCFNAHEPLMRLAEALKSPIVHALGGKEGVEGNNPYDVGMTGLIGFASGYHAMKDCDTLLMLGTDFPYRQFYPEKAKIAQIDLRARNLGRRCTLDLGLVGDVVDTIEALLPRLQAKPDRTHLDDSLAAYARSREGLDELAVDKPGHKPIHPQYLAQLVSEIADQDAVFTFDVGTPAIWVARYLKMNGKRRIIGSLNHGSMANALPQSIGAQASHPDRQVIALCGDGGFSMLMGDLLTLNQHKLPVKIVIFNNGVLGFVDMEMKGGGYLDTAVELTNPDFAAMATGAGFFARRVEDPVDLEAALRAAFAHDGPALLDVVTARHELSMPPAISGEQVKGFSLWLAKAVLNGRGNEIIDLARQNLLR